MKKTLFVIDLMPFLYRGHFAFLTKPRITAAGINTSALLGFVNGVISMLKDYSPTHAVLAMDPDGKTFRHEAYPPYKAQRQKMPEDLAANIPRAFEVAEAFKIPVLRKEGFEADDIIGTLAKICCQPPASVIAPGRMKKRPITIRETCTTSVRVTAHIPPAMV